MLFAHCAHKARTVHVVRGAEHSYCLTLSVHLPQYDLLLLLFISPSNAICVEKGWKKKCG